MPRQKLKAVRLAARAVREALVSLHHVLEDGFDEEFLQVLPFTRDISILLGPWFGDCNVCL